MATKKNQEAGTVYKALILALLDNYKSRRRDKSVTQTLHNNFLEVFSTHPSVPITPLIEPYTRLLTDSLRNGEALSSDEVEFIVKVGGLELGQRDSLSLLEVMRNVYFEQPVFANCVQAPMLQLIDRNRRNVRDFVEGIVQQACHRILLLKRDEKSYMFSPKKGKAQKSKR